MRRLAVTRGRFLGVAAAFAVLLASTPGSPSGVLASGPLASVNVTRCAYADGTVVPASACIYSQEFSGTTLPSEWACHNDWDGPLQGFSPNLQCYRCENVLMPGDGTVHLRMSSNARGSCPQTWTAGAGYATACSGNCATNWPTGAATSYDAAYIDMPTFRAKYGHWQFRIKAAGGTGPGTDVTLWGSNCQASTGVIGELMKDLFNGGVGTSCAWPQPGSTEQDIINYNHATNISNTTNYVSSANGAPLVSTFYGTSYYGAQWASTTIIPGVTQLYAANPGDLSTTFHVYDYDWFPSASGGSAFTFSIDGFVLARQVVQSPTWLASDMVFPMVWNPAVQTVTAGTLPQDLQIDYVRFWCQPGITCPYVGP